MSIIIILITRYGFSNRSERNAATPPLFDEMKQSSSYKVAFFGLATALSLVLAYIDTLIPLSASLPGIRLGLANCVTVLLLYRYSGKAAVLCSFVRVLLSWLLFSGSLPHLLYSASGAAVSFFVMLFLKKTDIFGTVGVSVAGGVFHNIAQIFCAFLLTETAGIFSYLPFLLLAGTVSGAGVGLISVSLVRTSGRIFKNAATAKTEKAGEKEQEKQAKRKEKK